MSYATKQLEAVMREAGQEAYPNEACGLVVAIGKKSVPVVCANSSEYPNNQFLISADEYAQVASRGQIVGIWHTHVNIPPKPSQADLVGCELSAVPWFIMSIYKTGAEFTWSAVEKVEPSGYEAPYLERPYVFGVFDCWSLVRDYYKREFEIELSDFPRIHEFWAKGHDFFGDNWQSEGFVQLHGQKPEIGDTFLLQTDNTGKINHVAIYIGNEQILHHAHGRLSRRDVYGGYWKKHTVLHLRHKTKC